MIAVHQGEGRPQCSLTARPEFVAEQQTADRRLLYSVTGPPVTGTPVTGPVKT